MAAEFKNAPEVAVIAVRLIPQHHTHLAEAKIRYLFRIGPWEAKGKTRFGSARKCSAQDKHLHGQDFIVLINDAVWDMLTDAQRVALVDHELSHCGRDENENWCIYGHDLEEFTLVVKRHGLWRSDVEHFVAVAKQFPSGQLSLLDDPDEAEDSDAADPDEERMAS